jgi:AraC-like DNA-binding protein
MTFAHSKRSNFALSIVARFTSTQAGGRHRDPYRGASGGNRLEAILRSGLSATLPGAAESITVVTADETNLSRPVRSAVRHMTLNYADPVTLGDLSSLTKLSEYQIIRAFRRELGITPHAWLIRHRVRMGTKLLRMGESIATVATEVGFADQTHFTRHFKRLHGETPARFLTSAAQRTMCSLTDSSGRSQRSRSQLAWEGA